MTARAVLSLVSAMVIMHAVAAVALPLYVLSLGRARRFCVDVLMRRAARAILAVGGLRLHADAIPSPAAQCVYVFNHTSSLDLLIAVALGLPRARFFMKRRFALLPAFGVLGPIAGVFFTPPQSDRAARVRCFSRACDALAKSGDSVFLSPEGTRVTSGEIGPFNKGAFHLAAALGAPIVPLYFRIDARSDPGKGMLARPGEIRVHALPVIDTRGWRVDDASVCARRDAVRAAFIAAHSHAPRSPSAPTPASRCDPALPIPSSSSADAREAA